MDNNTKKEIVKKALKRKLNKVQNRLKLIDRYVSDANANEMNIAQWMHSKGLRVSDLFASIGFDFNKDLAVSNDSENKFLKYAKSMVFSPEKGYFVSNIEEEKSGVDGYLFNEKTNLYSPLANTPEYEQSISNRGDELDEIDGFSLSQIGDLDISNSTNKYKLWWLKEAISSEYDNLASEYNNIDYSQEREQKIKRNKSKRKERVCMKGNPFDLIIINNK